jgi:hypothetical protein
VPIVLKSGSLNLLEPSGPVQACNGIALPFVYHKTVNIRNMKHLKVDLARFIQVWSVWCCQWINGFQHFKGLSYMKQPTICLMHDNEDSAVHQNIRHNPPNDMASWACVRLLGLTAHYQNSMEQSMSWEADSSFTIPYPEPGGDSSFSLILFEIHFNSVHPQIVKYSLSLSHLTAEYRLRVCGHIPWHW